MDELLEESLTGENRSRTDGTLFRAEFDWTETLPSRAIAQVLADIRDVDIFEFGPISDDVDPDALNQLVTANRGNHISVDVVIEGHPVSISGNELTIGPRETPAETSRSQNDSQGGSRSSVNT